MRTQMVLGDCRSDLDSGRRRAGLSDADLGRHPDRGYPVQGRQGQHHERPALYPAERHRADPRPRHSRGPRLHQFARDPGRLCHRIRPPRLRGAGARPDRPRLQRPAGLRQRLWRPGWAGASAQPRHRRQEQYRPRGPLDGRLDRARRRDRDAERLQVDGAGGLVDRQAVRRRRHAELAAQRRAGVRAIRGIFRPDVGRRAGPRRHPKPETLGDVRHARRRSSPARSMATSRKAPRGCSTRPRSPTRTSTFRTRRSATASTGSPRPCRAARRCPPTTRSGSARKSAR